jgi:hypothetical protein
MTLTCGASRGERASSVSGAEEQGTILAWRGAKHLLLQLHGAGDKDTGGRLCAAGRAWRAIEEALCDSSIVAAAKLEGWVPRNALPNQDHEN